MKRFTSVIFLLFFIASSLSAQKKALNYFLPEGNYNSDIPTPEEFLGYQIGEWHVSHDQLKFYMRELAEKSDRVQLNEYARTYEGRHLQCLTITSKDNFQNLAKIKKQHQELADPDKSGKVNIDNLPAVIYQGYSVHGNESSGGNAALLVAYYLAAAERSEVNELLENVVILLDPCMNPDGFHRFSTWANSHKSFNLNPDPNGREFSEVWPGGRTNHYWFDLNRDWLLVQHPESQGRINIYQDWKPNILTDHHEMGSNNTYFFQPGVPARTNPITPQKNQDLTKKIGAFHAEELNKVGSFYYSEESFDDFYYGKGSTYPDVNGGIGILFEQASSRGHLRQTSNGLLSFPFTIRNQVLTSFSTQKAAFSLRRELLDYKRAFYKTARNQAKSNPVKAFVFGDEHDNSRAASFIDMLHRHKIKVYQIGKDLTIKRQQFLKERAYVVPLNQAQSRLIMAMFETRKEFKDSIFYDVSTWTMPLAFNLDYAALDNGSFKGNLLGDQITAVKNKSFAVAKSNYAYLFRWDDYYAPKAMNLLLQKGLMAKVAKKPFSIPLKNGIVDFPQGTIMIPVQNQPMDAAALHRTIESVSQQTNMAFHDVHTGLTPTGIDLGSPNFALVKKPKPMVIGGDGTYSYEVGEVWHLLDQRYEMPPTVVEGKAIAGTNLTAYTAIIMTDGSHSSISKNGVAKIKSWLSNGGTLICTRSAVRWAKSKKLANITYKTGTPSRKNRKKETKRRPYIKASPDRGAHVIGGAIFEVEMDLTHPLTYGYHDSKLASFHKGTTFMEPGKNAYSTPLVFTKNALLSGYISKRNEKLINNSAAAIVTGIGRGRVICFADNPNFRAFWYGTNKLMANAIFFGNQISGATVESAPGNAKKEEKEEDDGHGHQH